MREVLVMDNYFIPMDKDNLPYYQIKSDESEKEKDIKFALSLFLGDLVL